MRFTVLLATPALAKDLFHDILRGGAVKDLSTEGGTFPSGSASYSYSHSSSIRRVNGEVVNAEDRNLKEVESNINGQFQGKADATLTRLHNGKEHREAGAVFVDEGHGAAEAMSEDDGNAPRVIYKEYE